MTTRAEDAIIIAEIPGNPMPCPRPRVGRKGTYYPKSYQYWLSGAKALLRDACVKQNGGRLIEAPVSVTMVFMGARGNADTDNLIKAVLDAAQGQVILNDRQVKHIEASNKLGEPGTNVVVRRLSGNEL